MLKPAFEDYGHTWWEGGYTGENRTLYMQTRLFGAALKCNDGKISHFGAFSSCTAADRNSDQASEIDAMPALEVTPLIIIDGHEHRLTGITPIESYRPPFGQGPDLGVYNRILESGLIVQRCDLMLFRFENTEITGRLELALYPAHCALSFELFSKHDCSLTLNLTLRREGGISQDGLLVCGDGAQYLDVAGCPSGENGCSVQKPLSLNAGCFSGITLIILPSVDGAQYTPVRGVLITAETLTPEKGARQPVNFTRDGIFNISQDNMFSCSGASFTDQNVHTCDQLLLTVKNPYSYPVRVPVCFEKNRPLSITGLCPLLRNENGEPLGIPVQLSKNWHYFSVAANEVSGDAPSISPKRHFEGQWFHGYAVLDLPANSESRLIYTCTFGMWGSLYAVSHAQLCLAGWGGGQQWETSALGSFGESFCYDIARTWTWCCMGDICPALISSRIDGHKYDWTGNIGGGDFLFYISGGRRVGFAAMRTDFIAQGPCMTEVHYRGKTDDDAVLVHITVFMGRTNDLAHALHRFEYTFVKDVSYERMSFYQMGSDSYNYDYWSKACIGSGNEIIKTYTIKDGGENKVSLPEREQWGDYVDYGVTAPDLYFGMYECEKGHAYGNKLLLVPEYSAEINGKSSPLTMAVRTSNVMERWKSIFPELVPPQRSGIIKKGSKISGCADYICLPAVKSEYYGGASRLLSLPGSCFDTPEMLKLCAAAGKIRVLAVTGKVLRTYPPLIKAQRDKAEFTLDGGFAYTPVSICGVCECSGFECLKQNDDEWEPLALTQQREGNDYWQCRFNMPDGTYTLTFNLEPGRYIIKRCP